MFFTKRGYKTKKLKLMTEKNEKLANYVLSLMLELRIKYSGFTDIAIVGLGNKLVKEWLDNQIREALRTD